MAESSDHVEILLSTYNGAEHLETLLESIIGQDHNDVTLVVRDDGSSDATLAIIRNWQARYPDRIRFFEGRLEGNVGAVGSFSRLLQASRANYVMFADQDDVWLPDKVRVTLDAMKRREGMVAPDQPILVHTDLTLVDQDLRTLSASSWAYSGIVPGRGRTFSRIMVENIVWGCTSMLNRPLIELVGSIPAGAVHHDWWIALVAAALGDVVSLRDSRILWRRHGLNVSDISNIQSNFFVAVFNAKAAREKLDKLFSENRIRVQLFVDRYGDRLKAQDLAAAKAFLHLPDRPKLARRLDIIRHGLLFSSRRRNLGLLALM